MAAASREGALDTARASDDGQLLLTSLRLGSRCSGRRLASGAKLSEENDGDARNGNASDQCPGRHRKVPRPTSLPRSQGVDRGELVVGLGLIES